MAKHRRPPAPPQCAEDSGDDGPTAVPRDDFVPGDDFAPGGRPADGRRGEAGFVEAVPASGAAGAATSLPVFGASGATTPLPPGPPTNSLPKEAFNEEEEEDGNSPPYRARYRPAGAPGQEDDPLANSLSTWWETPERKRLAGPASPEAAQVNDHLDQSLSSWWNDGQFAPDGRTPTTREFLLDTSVKSVTQDGKAPPANAPFFTGPPASACAVGDSPPPPAPGETAGPAGPATPDDPLSLSTWWATPDRAAARKTDDMDTWYSDGKAPPDARTPGVTKEYLLDTGVPAHGGPPTLQ